MPWVVVDGTPLEVQLAMTWHNRISPLNHYDVTVDGTPLEDPDLLLHAVCAAARANGIAVPASCTV